MNWNADVVDIQLIEIETVKRSDRQLAYKTWLKATTHTILIYCFSTSALFIFILISNQQNSFGTYTQSGTTSFMDTSPIPTLLSFLKTSSEKSWSRETKGFIAFSLTPVQIKSFLELLPILLATLQLFQPLQFLFYIKSILCRCQMPFLSAFSFHPPGKRSGKTVIQSRLDWYRPGARYHFMPLLDITIKTWKVHVSTA